MNRTCVEVGKDSAVVVVVFACGFGLRELGEMKSSAAMVAFMVAILVLTVGLLALLVRPKREESQPTEWRDRFQRLGVLSFGAGFIETTWLQMSLLVFTGIAVLVAHKVRTSKR